MSKQLPAPWGKDLAAAQVAATTSKQPVLVMFSTTWCPPCQELLRDVLPEASVAKELDAIHCVYVDGDAHVDLVESHKVEGFPTFVFLDHTGKETRRQVGINPTKPGFLALLAGKPQPTASMNDAKGLATDATADVAAAGQPEPVALAALKSLQADAHHFKGTVKIKTPVDDSAEMFMVMGDAGVVPEAFAGDLEVVTTDSGDRLIASTSSLPGIVVFKSAESVVTRTTSAAGTVLDSTSLVEDLCLLLDTKRIVDWAAKDAKWTKTDNEDVTVFSTKVPRNVVESQLQDDSADEYGMTDPMAVHIMRGELSLTTNREGELQSIRWTLVRNDPFAVMAEIADESGGEIDFEMIAELPPIAGPSITTGSIESKRPSQALALRRLSKSFAR